MKPYYQDEWVTIYHGDCREILPELPKVDLVLTDPPYGVSFRGNEWDCEIPNWLPQARLSSELVIFTTGTLTLWDYPRPDWVICWARPASNSRSKIGGFSAWSPVLVYGKVRFPTDFKSIHAMVGSEERNLLHHPTPKPERLWEWLIVNSTEVGDTILDPFLGSGTTCYCAKKLNRKCIGIEIEEKYCEIAAKRCSQGVMELNI
ncbi:hypothetical protein ES703_94067 [subsurface metagenome]